MTNPKSNTIKPSQGKTVEKKKKLKPNKCECNFKPPRLWRVDKAFFDNKEVIPEFFCAFCKGLIVNDMEYIKEVVKYYSQQRWSSMSWNPHRDKEHELEEGNKMFLKEYRALI